MTHRERWQDSEKVKDAWRAVFDSFSDRLRYCGVEADVFAKSFGMEAPALDALCSAVAEAVSVPPEAASARSNPLHTLSVEINEINRANGWAVVKPEEWADTYKIPGILALIHSEVSEALEGFRHNDRANFDEELADVLIRVLDCAGGLGIDLDAEVARKLTKNRARGFKHGGKRV